MKPIRLELKEFGPYKNEIIEWDKIINEPIFLITGKTGSGKSTLFDAITYALYNKTTGGKDIASLRTKTALDKDKTQVNFDFELSGKKYRIERTLAYLKAGNKNLTSGKVALMQYTDEKLEVIASKEQEAKEKVKAMSQATVDGVIHHSIYIPVKEKSWLARLIVSIVKKFT